MLEFGEGHVDPTTDKVKRHVSFNRRPNIFQRLYKGIQTRRFAIRSNSERKMRFSKSLLCVLVLGSTLIRGHPITGFGDPDVSAVEKMNGKERQLDQVPLKEQVEDSDNTGKADMYLSVSPLNEMQNYALKRLILDSVFKHLTTEAGNLLSPETYLNVTNNVYELLLNTTQEKVNKAEPFFGMEDLDLALGTTNNDDADRLSRKKRFAFLPLLALPAIKTVLTASVAKQIGVVAGVYIGTKVADRVADQVLDDVYSWGTKLFG